MNSDLSWNIQNKRKNHALFPKFILGLIIGPSSCGKTNWVRHALIQPEEQWLDYNRLYIFGKSLHQIEYQIIKKAFELNLSKSDIHLLFKNQHEIHKPDVDVFNVMREMAAELQVAGTTPEVEALFFDESADVPDPSKLDKQKNNLMIFDDLMMETNQNMCESYYTRGRHNNCDCFYLSQNYVELPKRSIRDNCNFIILFPQDDVNLRTIWSACASRHMDLKEFTKFCNDVWDKDYNFVTIDKTRHASDGRYRTGIKDFYIPMKFQLKEIQL